MARAYVYFVDKNEWMGWWVDLKTNDFDKALSKPKEVLHDLQTLNINNNIIKIAGNNEGWRLVKSLLHHQANAPSGNTFHPASNLFTTTAELARALSQHKHIYFTASGITISEHGPALGARLGAALGDAKLSLSARLDDLERLVFGAGMEEMRCYSRADSIKSRAAEYTQ